MNNDSVETGRRLRPRVFPPAQSPVGYLRFAARALAFFAAFRSSVAFAGEPKIPDLLPARAELPPTYWEQHGWLIIALSVAGLLLLALAIYILTRPKPAAIVPPEVMARRSLQALRGQPEDGALLMKVSGILRQYIIRACGFPPRERTTAELSRDLEAHPQLDRALAGSIVGFMRQCDDRKFAPQPPAAPTPAVDAALELIDRVEAQREKMSGAIPPQPPPSTTAAAARP